jgi:L-glyceraldehyde reductase
MSSYLFLDQQRVVAHLLMYDSNDDSVVDDPLVIDIANKLSKDPAAVLISWAVQRGTAVLPKSVTPSRIESNFQGM